MQSDINTPCQFAHACWLGDVCAAKEKFCDHVLIPLDKPEHVEITYKWKTGEIEVKKGNEITTVQGDLFT